MDASENDKVVYIYLYIYIYNVRSDYENFAAVNERVQAVNSSNDSNPLGSASLSVSVKF